MKSYEPMVEFCIKIVENGEVYYEDGVINDIPENSLTGVRVSSMHATGLVIFKIFVRR